METYDTASRFTGIGATVSHISCIGICLVVLCFTCLAAFAMYRRTR